MDNVQAEAIPLWAATIIEQVNQLSNTVKGIQDREENATSSTPPLSTNTDASRESTTGPLLLGKPTKHLGPLATYDGDREGLEPWISQAEAKLQVDYRECSEATRFFMIHNQLRGEASYQLQP